MIETLKSSNLYGESSKPSPLKAVDLTKPTTTNFGKRDEENRLLWKCECEPCGIVYEMV